MSALFNLFYIYDPWFFHFLRMAFVAGLLAIVWLAMKKWKNALPQGIIIPKDSLIALLGLIAVSLLPMLLHGSGELGVILQYSKALILFLFGIAVYNLFYAHADGKQQLVRDLKIGIIAQSVVGFFALAGIPAVIEFALSSNAMMPRFFGSEQEYRLYNITSMAFFQLSLFYLLLLHFLLAYHEKSDKLNPIFLFLLLCIGLISGRTFLLLAFIPILLYFKWRYLPALVAFAALCLYLALYCADNRYVLHALEPLINILKLINLGQGVSDLSQISSSSDNLMKNHLYLPQLKQILIGDGYYYTPDGRYYGATDSGFIRQLLYGGIGYLTACFLFTAYFVYRIAQHWFDGSWKFTFSLLAIFSILHIKADTYAFPGIMLVLLMFLSLFGRNRHTVVLFQSLGSRRV